MPHLHARWIEIGLGLRPVLFSAFFGPLAPLLDAEKEGLSVIGPSGRRIRSKPHPARKSVVGQVIVNEALALAREIAPGEKNLACSLAAVVAACPKRGQIVLVLPPGQTAEQPVARIEDPQCATRRVVELDAVAGAIVCVDRESKQAALVLPGKARDAPEVDLASVREEANDQVGRRLSLFGLFERLGFLVALVALLARVFVEREVCAVIAEVETPHVFHHLDMTVFETNERHLVANRLGVLLLPPPDRLGIADLTGEPPGIIGETRMASLVHHDRRLRAPQVVKLELAGAVHPAYGNRQPVAVGR